MEDKLYLAYGSNLHPVRLQRRVPSARPWGPIRLPGYRLRFNKRSGVDDSAKATLEPQRGAVAWGVLFAIDPRERPFLDEAESLGAGYHLERWTLEVGGAGHRIFTYRAQDAYLDETAVPFDWYRDLVLEGARYHRFPLDYVAALETVPARPDDDAERARRHRELLQEMRGVPVSVTQGNESVK